MGDYYDLNIALRNNKTLYKILDQLNELDIYFDTERWKGKKCDCCNDPFTKEGILRAIIGTTYIVVNELALNASKEKNV